MSAGTLVSGTGAGRGPSPPGSRWRPSAKASAYVTLVFLGVTGALLTGRPDAVVLASPFAFALALGLARTRPLRLDADAAPSRTVATAGDEMAVTASFRSAQDVPSLEVFLCPSPIFGPGGVPVRPHGRALPAEEPSEVEVVVSAKRWGSSEVGRFVYRATSSLGLFEADGAVPVVGEVKVYPAPQALRRLVRSRQVTMVAGAQVARTKATGFELAGVRRYTTGDRAKDVNWRASARHQALFTNERHPDRGTDVVLVLDTFDGAVLERAVTAACSLADAYLAQRDRLALVKLGGSLRWLRPGLGPRQRYLVVDSLLSTTLLPSAVYRGTDLLPPRILPPGALVLVLSSLEHAQSRAAVADMRARGLDVVVIELPPPAAADPGLGLRAAPAFALWRMRRDMERDVLRAAGVPTVAWPEGRSLAQVVEEVDGWSRQRAHSHA